MWLLLFCPVDVTAWTCHVPGITQSHHAKPSVSFTVFAGCFPLCNGDSKAWTTSLLQGPLSCGYPSYPPHCAHLHVPGAAAEALRRQGANLMSPGTPVLSCLEEWMGVDSPPPWPGPMLCSQQAPALPPLGWLGLLTLPRLGLPSVSFVPFLAPLKWHFCPTYSPLGCPVFSPHDSLRRRGLFPPPCLASREKS